MGCIGVASLYKERSHPLPFRDFAGIHTQHFIRPAGTRERIEEQDAANNPDTDGISVLLKDKGCGQESDRNQTSKDTFGFILIGLKHVDAFQLEIHLQY